MKKFSAVLAIAFICSFASVRKREEEEIDELFQNAINQVMVDENMAFNVFDTSDEIGNTNYLLTDQPTDLSQLLDGAINTGVFMMKSNDVAYLFLEDIDPQNNHRIQNLYYRRN